MNNKQNKTPKLYPFNCEKHAHSIEFRMNRCYNIMCDMQMREIPWNDAEYNKLEKLHDDLQDLLTAMMNTRRGYDGICWLTGKQIGLAKESVAWASETRSASLIKAGKTQYLQYC